MGGEVEILEEEAPEMVEEEVIEEESEDLEPQDDAESNEETEESEESEDEELVVSIGEEEPEEDTKSAPKWVKELRKSHRELQKQNRELKEKVRTVSQPVQQDTQLPKKPTPQDVDYDYEKYDAVLEDWFAKKARHDQEQEAKRKQQEEANQIWQKKLDDYNEKKASLKVQDFDEAEYVILERFSETQQGLVLQYATNPALLVYALGKNKKRAEALSKIKDPVEFAIEARTIEKELKVRNRSEKPSPEKTVRGSGKTSGTFDSTLDRLREKAQKTGDYTQVIAYKRNKK